MQYREEKDASKEYKKSYLSGIENIIRQRQRSAKEKRCEYFKDIFANREKYLNDLKKMLGWPLIDFEYCGVPSVTKEKLCDEEDFSIYRAQIEVMEGFVLSGLLYLSKDGKPKPMVIVQHGGLGTPEIVSGFYDGKTFNYNNMVERVVNQGVNVFAPQLLLWSNEYDVPCDRRGLDAHLKTVGSSITAVEVYALTRVIDYFETCDYVTRFGMVGLSYGGFYTLFTTAIDDRIEAAISCSFFNSREQVNWSDWCWQNSAEMFNDAEVACLVYPRKLCIQMGNKDQLFDSQYSEESFEDIRRICKDVGTDWVELMIFEGNHEFCKDDLPIKKLVEHISCEKF